MKRNIDDEELCDSKKLKNNPEESINQTTIFDVVPQYVLFRIIPSLQGWKNLKLTCRSLNDKLNQDLYSSHFCSSKGYHSSPYHTSFGTCAALLSRVNYVRSRIIQQIHPCFDTIPKLKKTYIDADLSTLEEDFSFTFPVEVREFLRLCAGASLGPLSLDDEFTAVIISNCSDLEIDCESTQEDDTVLQRRIAIGFYAEYDQFRVGCVPGAKDAGIFWEYAAPHPAWKKIGNFDAFLDYFHQLLVHQPSGWAFGDGEYDDEDDEEGDDEEGEEGKDKEAKTAKE